LSATASARAARLELDRLLQTDASALAARLPAGFADAVERYVALLLDANARLNLTRVVEPVAVARLHLLDALAALPLIDAAAPRRAVDLGSGGGVPGLVLALARPDVAWTLVESAGRKAAVLRSFAEALGLRAVVVIAERAESLGRDPLHRERYDLVTARACAALPVLVEYALPFLRRDGTLLAWKGPLSDADPEMRRGAAAASMVGGGRPTIVDPDLPVLGGHRFVVIPKVRMTPARFPRRPGEPGRRPLG
jgi:16S rRNA (guanine527-N7)-methyltransferase